MTRGYRLIVYSQTKRSPRTGMIHIAVKNFLEQITSCRTISRCQTKYLLLDCFFFNFRGRPTCLIVCHPVKLYFKRGYECNIIMHDSCSLVLWMITMLHTVLKNTKQFVTRLCIYDINISSVIAFKLIDVFINWLSCLSYCTSRNCKANVVHQPHSWCSSV